LEVSLDCEAVWVEDWTGV